MKYKLLFVWFCISVSLILPPFILGGVYSHLEANFVIIFATSLVSFCFFLYLLIFKKPVVISTIILPLSAILMYSIIQMIPFPPWFIKFLSPKAYYFQSIESISSRPLTMSIPDTIYSSLRVIVLLLFSIVTARSVFTSNKKIKQLILDTIIFTSTAVIFVSAAAEIIGIDKWFYGTLQNKGFIFKSIIINPNHAAAYFGISGLLALTVALNNDFKRKQIFYFSIFFIHSIAVVSTLSRGGILAYFLSIILLFFLHKMERKSEKLKTFFYILPVIFALFTAFYAGYSLIENEFDFKKENYFDKVENFKTVNNYFLDFYTVGSGLGSFPKVYPYYQSNPEMHFEQLENEPVQFVLETGIFFSAIIFLLFILIIFKGKKEPKRKDGLISILFFILIQNTVDFNLHNFSILFPVTAITIILAKPLKISGAYRVATIVLAMTAALFSIFMVSTEAGRKLCGYNRSGNYQSEVYLYPADYTVPMNEAIKKINSPDKSEMADSGQYISSAILKAPDYYFVYFLAGSYMARLGSSQSVEFYKKSAELNKSDNLKLLNNIYKDLRHIKKENAIIEIVEAVSAKDDETEKFLFEISKTNPEVLKYLLNNKSVYFMSAIKSSINKKEYVKAQKLIEIAEKLELSPQKTARLMILKGDVFKLIGKYEEAFKYYLKGSDYTQSYDDYVALAHCSLNLGEKEIELANQKLKKFNLLSTSSLVEYYKWLSKKEFKENNFMKGMKNLEKAADLSKNPDLMLLVVRRYSEQKMYANSLEYLTRIKRLFPDYNKEEVERMYIEQTKNLSEKEKELFKESLLKNYH